jgi:ribosomal protein S18 acetylase RimI-like enzyme
LDKNDHIYKISSNITGSIMNRSLLDNPGWYALNSHHRNLAIWGKIAVRYQPGTLIAGAMPENTTSGFSDLRDLVKNDETIGVLGSLPENLPGWEIIQTGVIPQMICDELKSIPHVEAVHLTINDVPEILDLIALAQPGPFLPRTIEMGQYLGLHKDGKLIAMAGERLHPLGFCEISAVCTHPDYRGRGYAAALTCMVSELILDRQEVPFLHLAPTNDIAMKLYKKLGFYQRKEIHLSLLQRRPI